MERTERQNIPVPPRRERRQAAGGEAGTLPAAPWRQRARNRRETIACMPVRAMSEQETPLEETRPQEQLVSTVEQSSDTAGRVQ